MGTEEKVLLKDDLDIEKGFNDAIDDLRKSLGQDAESGEKDEKGKDQKNLDKAGKVPSQFDKDKNKDTKPEEDEDEEEERKRKEREEEASYRKSIEETLKEEPQAAAAMDVEPFLLQLAKAIDEGIEQLEKAVSARVGEVEKLVKSIGSATLATAELQKSTRDMVKQIGEQPMPSGSLKVLRKARFDENTEVDTRDVLAKSRNWVKDGKIDLVEAGSIEGRINKGLLGKVHDALDQKVAALMGKEAK